MRSVKASFSILNAAAGLLLVVPAVSSCSSSHEVDGTPPAPPAERAMAQPLPCDRFGETSVEATKAWLADIGIAGDPTILTELKLFERPVTPDCLRLLAPMTQLQALDLDFVAIDDAALELLPTLPRLRLLQLLSNTITGRGLTALARQPALRSLLLGGKAYTDLSGLAVLTLNEVDIRKSPVTATAALDAVTPLAGSLTLLGIVSCGITDAESGRLRSFASLTRLFLDGNPITNAALEDLRGLSRLSTLSLSGTQLSFAQEQDGACTEPALAAIEAMPALVSIDLLGVPLLASCETGLRTRLAAHGSNVRLTGVTFEQLRTLFELQAMPLSDFIAVRELVLPPAFAGSLFFTHHLFSPFRQLESLVLKDTRMNDSSARSLAALKALKRLDLRGTAVSQSVVDELRAALPGCMILR